MSLAFLGFRFLDLVFGFLGFGVWTGTLVRFVSICKLGVEVGAVVVCCLNATGLEFGA